MIDAPSITYYVLTTSLIPYQYLLGQLTRTTSIFQRNCTSSQSCTPCRSITIRIELGDQLQEARATGSAALALPPVWPPSSLDSLLPVLYDMLVRRRSLLGFTLVVAFVLVTIYTVSSRYALTLQPHATCHTTRNCERKRGSS